MTKHRKNGGSRLRQRAPKALNVEDLRRREDEVYGLVKSNNGSCWTVQCQSSKDPRILQEIRCKLKHSCRMRINAGNYVKVVLPSYNDSQGYITLGYRDGDIETLKCSDLWDFPEDQVQKGLLDLVGGGDGHLVNMISESPDSSDEGPSEEPITTMADKVQTAIKVGGTIDAEIDIDLI